jgi:hypothetical protein
VIITALSISFTTVSHIPLRGVATIRELEAGLDDFLDRDLVGRDVQGLFERRRFRLRETCACTDRNLAWRVGP